MILSLRYSDLSGAVSEANKLANELGQYCDELSQKVQQKMYSVEGGMSNALNSADYYVNQKIRQLRTRENNARTLSTKTQELLETAKRVDTEVERTIQANQKTFFEKNPELKAPWYQQAITSFLCDMKNVPVIGWLIKRGEQIASAMDILLKDIRYWYKCEGGKELVGIVLSAVAGIFAIVIAVCAFAFTGGTIFAVIVGVAGVISAIIGVVNAVTNVVTSFQAYYEAKGENPEMAKIYAGQDKLSDVLKQTNFHNKEWNRGSNICAAGIEITDAICSVISFVSSSVKTIKKLKKINLKKTFQAICQPRNKLGQFVQGKPSFWNGMKSIVLKFNVKDLVLGDLNVKNLSLISKFSFKDQLKTIGQLAKGMKGIVSDFDKINEGKQSVTEFFAKRIVVGFDTMFSKQQTLKTNNKNGIIIREYENTNFSNIIAVVRLPIDGLGLGKMLTDKEHSGTLSNILNMKGGFIKNIKDIAKQIQIWTPPKVIFSDDSFQKVVDVKNWDSASGYFNKMNKINIVKPKIDICYNIFIPKFIMPLVKFNFKIECICPYYNIKFS